MKHLFLCTAVLLLATTSYAQSETKHKFRFIEVKSHFGAFLKSDTALSASGVLDNGYGGITVKLGWQPSDPNGWASRYGYPSYGFGTYVGFLSNADIFGTPNAIYGFMNFPLSRSDKRNVFSIEPSVGLTYSLEPFDAETNPLNETIGARMAVYFNVDFGFTYKFTRELDLLYGFDFSHFSNGSTFKPNLGLNFYGINLGMRYHYNAAQFKKDNAPYTNNVLPARFKRPLRSPRDTTNGNAISVYTAAGVAQSDVNIGTPTVLGTFSGVLDYEHQFNEMHGITGGVDFLYDNRFRDKPEYDSKTLLGAHVGYDFMFWKLVIKFQLGTYLFEDQGKGAFFMRPALRYNFSKTFFAQIGLKTLAGGSADYVEYGIGIRPFKW